MIDGLRDAGFDLRVTFHADAILREHFAEAACELGAILARIRIPVEELIRGGGGEAPITQRLRRDLYDRGWAKRIFHVEKTVDGKTTFSQSHEIDHTKSFTRGTLALEIEWNNKDPFFDRDLENFNRLHSDGAVSVGIIVTRGSTLQSELPALVRAFAQASAIETFADLQAFGVAPTRRQREAVTRDVEARGMTFADAWAARFAADKFGAATTHWTKLAQRLDRGVGSPCPIVAIGLGRSVVAAGA